MGVYLVDVGAGEWLSEDTGEGGMGAIAKGLDAELARRGLPSYASVPERDFGSAFEEKLSPSMQGFDALCRAELAPAERELIGDWSVLVPISLDEEIRLPIGSAYTDETVIAGAPQVLAVAERLAAALELPAGIPEVSGNLALTFWFLEGEAEELAAAEPGRWSEDLDTAFYVALYLRAAQHALRQGCPLTYS
ncbi:hypothetical protein [Streptomyces prunicolor]|uniref:DUF1877 family protein n=1 Tax=Streptomyces prunicolor TaxID=67348 RepID=A0ABU4FB77_9ACTN|nr:hypothetical protein [Streptomyces prunicolor]MCX5240038.1 hypothetical protein [Streptomyces prunicolor]MDV7217834.1 hypothetical protein [Streptomyces prunicolor]